MNSWILLNYILAFLILTSALTLSPMCLLTRANWVSLSKRDFCLVHPWTWHYPSCHRVRVTCDNLPHFTSPHRWCTHWMQHYAALQTPSRDWWRNQTIQTSDRAAYFLYSLLFPDADLSFLFPVHSTCLLIFCSLHPCVCRCVCPGVMFCVCVPAVFVCNTLDAFAPSPGDGPAAVAAGPAADAFGGSGGWPNSFLCKCVCVYNSSSVRMCVGMWKLFLLLLY